MGEQSRIRLPGFPIIVADPETRGINPYIERARFALASRLDDPDVLQLLPALRRKLNAAFRLLPGLTCVVAIAQERAEEIAILGCKQAAALALIKDRVIDAASL